MEDNTVKIKILNLSSNSFPEYTTEGSAAMDIKSNEDCCIISGNRLTIKTGLFLSIPKGYEIQIRSRSGMAAKHGICVLNSPGTIDSDYLGEIMVILQNHNSYDFVIKKGDRIAQMKLAKVPIIAWNVLNDLEFSQIYTGRGSQGLGSTGK